MNRFSIIRRDDANDTLLFKRLEKNALKRFHNPHGIGCPGQEILKRFVETPNEVTVAELNGWHIYKCRECTLQLKELRRLREERLRATERPGNRTWIAGLRPAFVVAALCVLIATSSIVWKIYSNGNGSSPRSSGMVKATIDLSQDGPLRGKPREDAVPKVTVARQVVGLDIILPYYSPAGEYRVAVTKDKNSDATAVEQHATAIAQGPHTELHVTLDLHRLPAGEYNLRTIRIEDGTVSFYPVNVR